MVCVLYRLARGAMQDDLSGLSRAVTADVVGAGGDAADPAKLVDAWQDRNRRALERAAQLVAELRAAPLQDAAMLSVALRELRSLA